MASAAYAWIRARHSDEERIRAFLEPREAWACACSGRLRSVDATPSAPVTGLPKRDPSGGLTLPSPGKGALYLLADRDTGRVGSLILFSSTGTVFPVLDESIFPDPRQLPEALRKLRSVPLLAFWKPSAALGLSGHVSLMEECLSWSPKLRIGYYTMALDTLRASGSDAPFAVEGEAPGQASECDISITKLFLIRKGRDGDIEGLMPLAQAYDEDEVLTPLHTFDYHACRASQLRSLARYRVFVAEASGSLVGRAQTNATGWAWEQLGGIYLRPDYRGKGIAFSLVRELVSSVLKDGKRPCLFVKKANVAARRLYEKLGFAEIGDFSVDYF